MSTPRRAPRLHVVTDDGVLARGDFRETAEALLIGLGPGVALHLRGHATDAAALHAHARDLAAAGRRSGAGLLVNDRVDIALAMGLDGVQLGRRSLPIAAARGLLGGEATIGFSAHSADEAASAAGAGADFVLAGPVFTTTSHPGEAGHGLSWLRAVAAACRRPVLAIGGLDAERARAAVAEGAHGAAVIGAVWGSEDPLRAARELLASMTQGG